MQHGNGGRMKDQMLDGTTAIGPQATRRKIAVIGAGISGMGAAWMLAAGHHVVLYEAEDRIGGHARTRMAGPRRDQAVDTGFIVFNHVNYPHLTRLFAALEVPVRPSNMSFGASIRGGEIEYALAGVNALFAQRRNLLRPAFLRMIRDIFRFNARALEASREEGLTIGGLLEKLGTGDWFRDHYLLPLSGAIWSTPTEKILDFPAHAMVRFFDNHALLQATGQHQWFTVDGGSWEYVRRLEADMRRRGAEVRTGTPVAAVRRGPLGPEVRARGGQWERYDDVVFATHSDDTLAMLADPTPQEAWVLGAIRYQPNRVVLHSDAAVMPKRRAVWSSWTYAEPARKSTDRIDMTYWMNSLQHWLKGENVFVTLNATRPIREELIWDECVLRHPVYDLAALAAQEEAARMNGANRTWFCGAWMRNGFHEDGLASAVEVVRGMARRPALQVAAE
jgi:predicted NAD/FAD-binding protein